MRSKIDKNYERKEFLINNSKDPEYFENIKRQWFVQVKFVLEADLKKSPLEA
jgi:hypothetical protein